jgi:hypothetical protein
MTFAGVNYLAVLIAAVGGWVTGAIWYGLFGKSLLAALGKTKADMKRRKKTPAFYAPFAIAFAAVLIMARGAGGLLGHLGPGQVTLRNGVISGAFCWLGFVATTITVNYAFAMRKAMLTVIDSGHWLAELIVMGAIIGAMGVR